VFERRVHASPTLRIVLSLAAVLAFLSVACNEDRRRECQALVVAMKPIDAPDGNEKAIPSLETVTSVKKEVEALKPTDHPLHIHADNYAKTLSVLANTLALKTSSSAPDGTDDVIKKNLKLARAQADDVRRYCVE
jgi:hypothetical protein